MKTYDELKKLFETANKKFIKDDIDLFNSLASERALCGALMLHLDKQMMINHEYDGYYSDVEYNRNRGNIKTIAKTIMGPEMKIIKVQIVK